MKKILMISQSVFPPDIRLEKEIRSLSRVGFKIAVLCNQYNKENNWDFPFCEIYRIGAIFKSIKMNRIINFPLFLNPRYLFAMLKLMIVFRPDYIHGHDLPMAPLAIIYGKLFGKRIIFDMHENYPQALKSFDKKGLLNFVFKNYHFALFLEKFIIRTVDYIIVVIDENRDRLIKQGVSPDRIILVSNTYDIECYSLYCENLQAKELYRNRFLIIYTGGVSPERDLDTPIKSLNELKKIIPELILLIIGDGPSVLSLKQLSEKLKVQEFVKFIPWPGDRATAGYIGIADILIVPHPFNDFINTTIPHKLFEYMYNSKPVLVSDAIPLKRIINETHAGEVFKSNDPHDFAQRIIQIKVAKFPYGFNGRKAVENKYNWENDSRNLINLYTKLENNG